MENWEEARMHAHRYDEGDVMSTDLHLCSVTLRYWGPTPQKIQIIYWLLGKQINSHNNEHTGIERWMLSNFPMPQNVTFCSFLKKMCNSEYFEVSAVECLVSSWNHFILIETDGTYYGKYYGKGCKIHSRCNYTAWRVQEVQSPISTGTSSNSI